MMKSLLTCTLACLLLFSGVAKAVTLNVMTSYPQPVVMVMQQAFEEAHPDIELNILWRRPHDALSVLLQEESENVDVIWMPSVRTFLSLKAHGKLAQFKQNRTGLPVLLGDTAISDPQGYFIATEIAGYGLFFEPEKLKQAGLAVPNQWQDLLAAEWQDNIALPIPSEVSFAHMLIDQLLQAEGWQTGWNQWQQIAANSHLMGRGGMFTTEAVLAGQAKVAFTMDFFAASSIANGANGKFIYPKQTAFNPAHVGILSAATQPEAANTFVDFIVSEQGQSLLLHPDLRKLPVRPSVYSQAPKMQNPFAGYIRHQYDYQTGLQRREYNAVVFDAAITLHHDKLKQAWQQWHQLQQNADADQQAALAEIKTVLQQWPVEEPAMDNDVLQDCAQRHDDVKKQQNCEAFKSELAQSFERQYDKALNMLAQLTTKS
ncbi:Phosphoglycerate transport regulatory protein PgtC precursor [Methylophaga muralis]|uniref:Phosphoglycerate transport regulatory protein PgtC n=2 Tax=Methylophaga muralis TaxID=291169 RepID=A0A1E3GR68_9GAMM|nr:Phosphoglycerate transport regulatory protein PgtC precursor [Methylophaga muralis]